MQKQHYSIHINAPREKVWDAMLDEKTYREWTRPFSPSDTDGRYEGGWNEGDEIRFIGVGEDGKEGGMFSKIAKSRKPEFLSIEHLGIIANGVVDTESDMVKAWIGAHENYTFNEVDGGTELLIDVDIDESMLDEFNRSWPLALQKLKEIAER